MLEKRVASELQGETAMNRAWNSGTVPRGLPTALCAVFALLGPESVIAQADAETLADFRACGALQRDSARLACFDGVLAADLESARGDQIADSAPVDEPVAPDALVAEAETEPEPAVAQASAAGVPRAVAAEAPEPAAPAPEPAQTEPQVPPPAPPEATRAATETPDESVEIQTVSAAAAPPVETPPAREARVAPSAPAEAPTLRIVEMRTRIPGAARFITDDGRVFVQTSGGSNYRNYPDVPFDATLEDGALGSTFLRLGPRLRVRVIGNDQR